MKKARLNLAQSDQPPETPFTRGQREFDRLIGSQVQRANQWRALTWALLIIAGIAGGGLVYLATQSRVATYIVEVKESGEVRVVGQVQQSVYEPTEASIKHYLARFITQIRQVPSDPIVLRQNYEEAYDFVTQKGRIVLDELARNYDPVGILNEELKVFVRINAVLKRSNANYQVEWTERVFGRLGEEKASKDYQASLDVKINRPDTERELLINPLGIYVNFFTLTERLY